ncbi:MAG: hypothetical protein J7647_25690 [Cyanobacteria bacterium SBLK]|nr:hypothetical protein [Cyanobacteria bacterium SBLK]
MLKWSDRSFNEGKSRPTPNPNPPEKGVQEGRPRGEQPITNNQSVVLPTRLLTLSLGILFVLHVVLGWSVADSTSRLLVWWLIGFLLVLTALVFTAPSSIVRKILTIPIRSDSRAFISVILLAFIAVILIVWIHHFMQFIALFAAASLVRLELQEANLGEWQAFTLFAIVSLTGFSLGLFAQQYLLLP